MALQPPHSGPALLLARMRSRMFRLRKHNSFAGRPVMFGIPLFILCLLVPNIFLFNSLTTPLPFPFRTHHLADNAGGILNYHYTPLQQDVRNVTRTMYRAYMDACMGRDEFDPSTNQCHDWFNIGLTVLDSLDTLVLMGLNSEYEQSRKWAETQLSFRKKVGKVSLFEIVIRAIGGLNSAYQLTNDFLWLNKSVELGDMLVQYFGFEKHACPPTQVYIGDNVTTRLERSRGMVVSSPAEAGTLQLEFRTLSHMTGDPKYAQAVDKCEQKLISAMPSSGLVPGSFNIKRNSYHGSRLSIGGGVDSFYEMLIKNWIAWGKEDTNLRGAYEIAVDGIFDKLLRKKGGHVFIGELPTGKPESARDTMDHLACFFPGTLAIAAQHGLGGGLHGEGENDYMPKARAITESCFAMTRGSRAGLAGEITDFYTGHPRPKVGHDVSFLRPEIVEALYYMDKLDPKAGDKYKKMGQIMWKDIRRSAQVADKPDGVLSSTFNLLLYGGKLNHRDKLHSFVIAETFKYFYLLFDERPPLDGPLSLDKWVYNTEAHPVRIVHHR